MLLDSRSFTFTIDDDVFNFRIYMKKVVGILGFGIVGRSLLNHLYKKYNVSVWDQRLATAEELAVVKSAGGQWFSPLHDGDYKCSMTQFVEQCKWVAVSAAVDTREIPNNLRDKLVGELDIFAKEYKKPTICITGSVGKTTTTALTAAIAQECLCKNVSVAGNIGVGLLDLIKTQKQSHFSVLELSSFQLEFSLLFTPSVVVFTNLHPNHIDRHGNYREYVRAKLRLCANLSAESHILLPVKLFDDEIFCEKFFCEKFFPVIADRKPTVNVLCLKSPTKRQQKYLSQVNARIFSVENGFLFLQNNDLNHLPIKVFDCSKLPQEGFLINWLFAIVALFLEGEDISTLTKDGLHKAYSAAIGGVGEHRLELCSTLRGVDVYNDSKATIMPSVHAAVESLAGCYKGIHIILGGIGKGVDRSSASLEIASKNGVTSVVCIASKDNSDFAKELAFVETLEDAIQISFDRAKPGQAVLFSPGGASFDFYKNYRDRGADFKKVVKSFIATKQG